MHSRAITALEAAGTPLTSHISAEYGRIRPAIAEFEDLGDVYETLRTAIQVFSGGNTPILARQVRSAASL
jgi:hypothetical protein